MPSKYNQIYAQAEKRKGEDILQEQLQISLLNETQLSSIPRDRVLSEITKAVFRAGFVWRVIEQKWPGFEKSFWAFNVDRCAHMSFEDIESLAKNTDIVRNRPKIQSVQTNASAIIELEEQYAGEYKNISDLIARWPAEHFNDLLYLLSKRFSRLGMQSTQYLLRFLGRDGYIIGRDGAAALIRVGVIDKPPTSIKAYKQIQDVFNEWTSETGYSQAQISRVLAMSIDA
ncbi:MAG: DNA-3-methyladenine glycosylase I [Gammaproteobacteria bacterium]|nr:DNA-3-methyladenine glycosylase I [Gammaproteobacteria bacterium]NNJ72787.1 3-methyladenine DNA glycosylase [Enterobacterales bacterium]